MLFLLLNSHFGLSFSFISFSSFFFFLLSFSSFFFSFLLLLLLSFLSFSSFFSFFFFFLFFLFFFSFFFSLLFETVRDGDDWTPLHAAVSGMCPEVVSYLLSVGADLKAVNGDKETAFDVAEDEEIQKILLGTVSPLDIDGPFVSSAFFFKKFFSFLFSVKQLT